jgi:hypothetical protein
LPPKADAAGKMRKGGKAKNWAARHERLSAALRENLKRRKAQARARTGPSGAAPGGEPVPETVHPAGRPPDFRRNQGSD